MEQRNQRDRHVCLLLMPADGSRCLEAIARRLLEYSVKFLKSDYRRNRLLELPKSFSDLDGEQSLKLQEEENLDSEEGAQKFTLSFDDV